MCLSAECAVFNYALNEVEGREAHSGRYRPKTRKLQQAGYVVERGPTAMTLTLQYYKLHCILHHSQKKLHVILLNVGLNCTNQHLIHLMCHYCQFLIKSFFLFGIMLLTHFLLLYLFTVSHLGNLFISSSLPQINPL